MAETAPTTATKTQSKAAPTSRSTAAKKAAATRARRQAAGAAERTTTAKKTTAAVREVERTPVERYFERAVDIQVGAALVARDTVVTTVNDFTRRYSSLPKVERELRARQRRVETGLRRFERRGTKARVDLERELRARRTRVERELRDARRDMTAHAELFGTRFENLVQTGVTSGTQVAAKVTEAVAKVA